MDSERLFDFCFTAFCCVWGTVGFLYWFKVIPAVVRKRGWRTILEAGLQLNFPRHIREYGLLAKHQNNKGMLRVFYLLNVLVVMGVLAFVAGALSTIGLQR
jgi:hypothetical protein